MAAKIFISYRRDDAKSEAARLRDRLAARDAFGAANVFMDVDQLLAGQRFDEELNTALAGTNVLLAVIGPRWLDQLRARQAAGERDYVREEIAGALKRRIIVIPALVDRATLPRAADLPEDISDLVMHQKHDLVYETFGRDAEALIRDIKRVLKGPAKPASALPWRAMVAAVALVAAGALAYVFQPPPWVKSADPGAPRESQVAIAAPKPQPAPAPPAEPACDDVLVAVAQGRTKPCIKPGSGVPFKGCADCPEMVIVPDGNFVMGSPESEPERESWKKGTESPQHRVKIAKPFAVGRFAVTFAQWDACEADGGCGGYVPQAQGWGRADRPVINVSWDDAKAYVAWLKKKTGKDYRLLSESEREYVTRAGTKTPFWWGTAITPEDANYNSSAYPYKGGGENGEYRQETLPVKSFKPNAWGLYQVHGNVWDWVEDCWNENYSGAPTDGSAWTTGECEYRVRRGGSWIVSPRFLRAAFRDIDILGYRSKNIGFRVALGWQDLNR